MLRRTLNECSAGAHVGTRGSCAICSYTNCERHHIRTGGPFSQCDAGLPVAGIAMLT